MTTALVGKSFSIVGSKRASVKTKRGLLTEVFFMARKKKYDESLFAKTKPTPKTLELIGQRFGKLVVISYIGYYKNRSFVKCHCDCGNETIACIKELKTGNVKSCGCLKKGRKKTHFQKPEDFYIEELTEKDLNERLRLVRMGMKQRCYNPKHDHYKYYGARGIKVCDEWLNNKNGLNNFRKWAIANGYKYIPNNKRNKTLLTLDRIDPNGNYEPSNCRWVMPDIQTLNRRKYAKSSP